jgi:hypothetical protein
MRSGWRFGSIADIQSASWECDAEGIAISPDVIRSFCAARELMRDSLIAARHGHAAEDSAACVIRNHRTDAEITADEDPSLRASPE